ncbi:MAG: zinc-ribbon domain-containing protein [Candidatus Thorarchaeota archaeon]
MKTHDQYCRECGTSIPTGAESCPKCGLRVSQVAQTATRLTVDTSRQTESSSIGEMVPMGDSQPGNYQISDGFMINTKTGDVWKYDENSGKFKVLEKEDSLLTSADKAKSYFALSMDFAQLANLDLQTQLDRQQKIMQTLSNISKKMHDEGTNIIRNLK